MIARTQHAPSRRRAILTLIVALGGCVAGGGTDGPDAPSGTVTITPVPPMVFLVQGGTLTLTVNFARAGYNGALTLSATGLPTGVTASFSPNVLSGSALSSSLTLTAAADVPTGPGGVLIVVTNADGFYAEGPLMVTVVRPQVNVTRNGTGSGTVTSSPGGINCGNTCSAGFAPGTNVTLTATPTSGSVFGGWSGGGCSGTATTCSLTLTASVPVTATFNSTAQGFSFAIDPTASVAQGGSATATANITRVNGYAGAVTLAVTGAPNGVTITTNPTSITGNTATLNITSAGTVAAGNYPITISATGAGIAGTQTAPLGLHVTPAQGGSGDVAISFADCDPSAVPIWFAVQNGTGAWTRVTPSSNTFTFTAGTTGGIAWVTPDGTGFSSTVIYGSRNEFTSLALGSQCSGVNATTGTKQLMGSITGAASTGTVTVVLGGASTQVPPPPNQPFPLNDVPAGRRDLIAVVSTPNTNGTTSFPRLIFRRNVNYAATIPLLDFNSAEFVVPTLKVITTSNGGSDQISGTASLVTANGSSAEYLHVPASSLGGIGYVGVPDSLLQPGDLHAVTVFAGSAGGSAFRLAFLLHHSAVTDAVAFGSALNQPTVTSIGTSPYLRLRAQLASQSEYNVAANAEFDQGANSVSVTTTAGYLGTLPTNWTIDIPDLTSAGYNPTWGLKSGSSVDWQVFAAAGSVLPFLGATPADGDRMLGAAVGHTSAAFSRFRSFKIWR